MGGGEDEGFKGGDLGGGDGEFFFVIIAAVVGVDKVNDAFLHFELAVFVVVQEQAVKHQLAQVVAVA